MNILKILFNSLMREADMFYLVQRRIQRASKYTVSPHFVSSIDSENL